MSLSEIKSVCENVGGEPFPLIPIQIERTGGGVLHIVERLAGLASIFDNLEVALHTFGCAGSQKESGIAEYVKHGRHVLIKAQQQLFHRLQSRSIVFCKTIIINGFGCRTERHLVEI